MLPMPERKFIKKMRNEGAPEQEHDLLYAETACSVSPRLHRLDPQEAPQQQNRSLGYLLFFHTLEVTIRWSVYDPPISVVARTVTRTIPSLLQAVPTYDAPKVWTHG